jgi:hypothetical protein
MAGMTRPGVRRRILHVTGGLVLGGLALLPRGAIGQRPAGSRAGSLTPADLAAQVVRALEEYRAALARALPLQEAEVADAEALLEERESLHAAGLLSAADVEVTRQHRDAMLREVEETRTALADVDRMLLEASVRAQLARLAPLRPGGYEATATLVRYNGLRRWSLRDVPALERAYAQVFGRALPISARGQTPLHTRLGLDHRNAIDVSVHPDSPEGEWLMGHLRAAGIPFIAVRQAIPGAATGAHIHIGAASMRDLAR